MFCKALTTAAVLALVAAAPAADSQTTTGTTAPTAYAVASSLSTATTKATTTVQAGAQSASTTVSNSSSAGCRIGVNMDQHTGTKPAGTHATHHVSNNLSPADAAAIGKKMHSELTAIDRYVDLLTNDKGELLKQYDIQQRVVFDFNSAAVKSEFNTGGRIGSANEKNFPLLTDLGISGSVAWLNPCSLLTPHIHPRASEMLTLVRGSKLQTGMMLENGFAANPNTHALTTEIKAELRLFQATVFPQGSIHFEFNPTCEPAAFVSALSCSDPGTSHIAQNFFFEDARTVNMTLGAPKQLDGVDINTFRHKLPGTLIQAVDSCLARCKKQPGGSHSTKTPHHSTSTTSQRSTVTYTTTLPKTSTTTQTTTMPTTTTRTTTVPTTTTATTLRPQTTTTATSLKAQSTTTQQPGGYGYYNNYYGKE